MKVKVDVRKNRLYLKVSGNVSKRTLESLYTDVRFAVADLQPGFSVIDDLSDCRLYHVSGIAVYKKISIYLISMGMRNVVRIINKDSLVQKQFFNFATRFPDYIPIYVNTAEEAEKQLDMPDRRNGLRFHFVKMPSVEYVASATKGNGHVINISTSGCKIKNPIITLSIGEIIDVKISFNAPDHHEKIFGVKARIVRIDNDEFAIEYQHSDEYERERLWQYLIREFEHESRF